MNWLMLALSQPGRNFRGKYWSWGIAIMSQASIANSVAEQNLKQFPDEVVCKINEMKFDGRSSRQNNGLQQMCYTIESFMVKMYKICFECTAEGLARRPEGESQPTLMCTQLPR
jgi:hypothetical protein